MQWNNTATSQGICQDIDFICSTNTATYTMENKTRNINRWYHRCIAEVLDAMDEWDFQGEVATADLAANQQEYPFPTNILKIKRVEVDMGGDGTYFVAKPMDPGSHDRSIATSAQINSNFYQTGPSYDTFDQSIFFYPVPDAAVTDGVKIWYTEDVYEFSAVTSWTNSSVVGNTGVPILAEPFQRILSLGASLDYAQKNNVEELIRHCQDELYGPSMRGTDRIGGLISKMKEFYASRAADKILKLKTKYFGENYQ